MTLEGGAGTSLYVDPLSRQAPQYAIKSRSRQLATVLAGPRPNYFIGGFVNRADRVVVLHRGDRSSLVVPLGWFNSHTAKADPTQFEITHWGQAVRLGDFEAMANAVLTNLTRSRGFGSKKRSSAKARLPRVRPERETKTEAFGVPRNSPRR